MGSPHRATESLFVRLESDWVHRRVERVEIAAATGVVTRWLSIDFAVPAELAGSAAAGTQVPVPLTYLRRAGLVDFTITDARGAAVPVLAEGSEVAHVHGPLTALLTGLTAGAPTAVSTDEASIVGLTHHCPTHADRLDACLADALDQTVAAAHSRDLTDPVRPDGADIRSVFTALARGANTLRPSPDTEQSSSNVAPGSESATGTGEDSVARELEACAGHIAVTLHRVTERLAALESGAQSRVDASYVLEYVATTLAVLAAEYPLIALLPADSLWAPDGTPVRQSVRLQARVAPIDADRMALRIVGSAAMAGLVALMRGPGRGATAKALWGYVRSALVTASMRASGRYRILVRYSRWSARDVHFGFSVTENLNISRISTVRPRTDRGLTEGAAPAVAERLVPVGLERAPDADEVAGLVSDARSEVAGVADKTPDTATIKFFDVATRPVETLVITLTPRRRLDALYGVVLAAALFALYGWLMSGIPVADRHVLIGGQSGGLEPTPSLSADWGKILVGYYSLTLASFVGVGFFSSTDAVSVTLMRRKYLLVFVPLILTALVPVVGADIRHWNTGATVLAVLWAVTTVWALWFYLTSRSPRPGRLPIEHRYLTAQIPPRFSAVQSFDADRFDAGFQENAAYLTDLPAPAPGEGDARSLLYRRRMIAAVQQILDDGDVSSSRPARGDR